MTSTRTDIHRPSAIDPADYTYIDSMDIEAPMGPADKGPGGLYETLERHDNATTAPYQGIPSRCDHCGAYLRYVVFWEHTPTGDVITTGEQCAHETMDVPNRLILDQKRLRETAAARRAAVRESEEVLERREIAKQNYPEAVEILDDYQGENTFIQDVAARFGKKGYLSERQAEAIVRAYERDQQQETREEEWQRKLESGEIQPCPEGKGITVEGAVVKVDWQENDFGSRQVMVVRDDRGFAVWGTVPSGLTVPIYNADGEGPPRQVGFRGLDRDDRVRFVANIEAATPKAGETISTFGFFKRPRKAEVLET